jgi:hypothetical protein
LFVVYSGLSLDSILSMPHSAKIIMIAAPQHACNGSGWLAAWQPLRAAESQFSVRFSHSYTLAAVCPGITKSADHWPCVVLLESPQLVLLAQFGGYIVAW